MPDPKQRIIVDGVDFTRILLFPRILSSVTSALQPPRLVLALLVVAALIAFGRLWDAFAEREINPGGLLKGEWTAVEQADAQALLEDALAEYGDPREPAPPEGTLDGRDVLRKIDEGYRRHRAVVDDSTDPPREDTTALPDDEEIDERDQMFLLVRAGVVQVTPMGPFEALSEQTSRSFVTAVQGLLSLSPALVLAAGHELAVRIPVALWQQAPVFTVVYGLLTVLILALGGGALCRMAACAFAKQERLRVRQAVDFALGNWAKLVLTPLLPLILAGIVAAAMIVLGLFMAPWLDLLGGLFYGLAIVLGFLLAFLLIGYALGGFLLLPAVACENCDAADAQQRAYAYVLNRPLHLIGYGLVALIGLAVGFLVVSLFAVIALTSTAWLVGLLTSNSALAGAGDYAIYMVETEGTGVIDVWWLFDLQRDDTAAIHAEWHNAWAASLVAFWETLVLDLVVAYVVSYLFTSATMVYLLLRRACDGQDVEEIWRPGLTPGTLVPLPRTQVSGSEEGSAATEQVMTSAIKKAASVRYGRSGEEESGERE